jgi:DNA-binding LytR/AlgR family response regulator
MYKCYLVDDEPLALKVIEQHLTKFHQFELVGKATNPLVALTELKHLQPDLLFIDIQMPEITGLELIESIQNKPWVVITTAYRDFAIQAFDLNAMDYLVKPISFKRFVKTIEKFLEQRKPQISIPSVSPEVCIYVKSERKVVKVNIAEILYVEGIKDYVRIVLNSQRILTKNSIGQFLELLPADQFIRVHKSFIVSLTKMKAYSTQGVEINDIQIPIGRVYKKAFFEVMQNISG